MINHKCDTEIKLKLLKQCLFSVSVKSILCSLYKVTQQNVLFNEMQNNFNTRLVCFISYSAPMYKICCLTSEQFI